MELISIIVPVYNCEKYLFCCINSIINQTYRNLEIILIDDGSTDRSSKICDACTKIDSRIQVFHTSNHGLSSARNYGIEKANGDYIAFVDADDWIDSHMYEILHKQTISTKSDLIMCNASMVYEDRIIKANKETIIETMSGDLAIKNLLFENNCGVSAWNKLYKKSLFEKIKFPEGRYFEDFWIMYKIFNACNKIAYDNRQLYFYRQRKGSIMHRVSIKAAIDWVDLFDDLTRNKILKNYKNEIAHAYLGLCRDMKARSYFYLCKKERIKVCDILNDGIEKYCKFNEISKKTYKFSQRIKKYIIFYVPKKWLAESFSKVYVLFKILQNKYKSFK